MRIYVIKVLYCVNFINYIRNLFDFFDMEVILFLEKELLKGFLIFK